MHIFSCASQTQKPSPLLCSSRPLLLVQPRFAQVFLPEIGFLPCISPDLRCDQCSSHNPSLHGNLSCLNKCSDFRCSSPVPAEHHLPFHHLQEPFHSADATFRLHVPLFHQDPTYLASQPLIRTPGNTGTALITIHYGNASLQTSRFDHQQRCGHPADV